MTGRRRQEQRAQTRRLVLDAACSLFEQQGYDDTTMRAVAKAAGVGLGTIFNHFPDKPALLGAAFREDLGAVVARAWKTLPDGDLKPRFLHLASALYGFYARRPRLGRVMVAHAVLLSDDADGALLGQARTFVDGLAGLVGTAIERGELRAGLSPELGGLALWSDYLLVLVAGLRPPGMPVEAQVALLASLVDLRIDGMRAPA